MAVTRSRLDDDPGTSGPALGTLARGVWRRWFVVLAVLLVTVAVAAALSQTAPKTYEASAEVRVSSGDIPSADGTGTQESNTLLATQVQYLLSSQLANDVAQRLDGDFDVVDMAVEGVPESQVAIIRVVSSTAEGAAVAANTYAVSYDERRDAAVVEEATARAEQTAEQVERLETRLTELQAEVDTETERVNRETARITIARDAAARVGTVLEPEDVIQPNTSFLAALQGQYSDTASQLTLASNRLEGYQQAAASANGGVAIVSAATPPSAPSSPGLTQVIALASILGLALGVGLALVLSALDQRVRTADDVAAVAGDAQVVGPTVGRADAAAMDLDGLLLPPLVGRTVDSYLAPATWLAGVLTRSRQNAVLVTSPRERQSAAGSLAVAMARCGQKVVLVDADLRGHAPGYLDPSRRRGLTDLLLGNVLPVDVISDVEVQGAGSLRIISAGRDGADVALLASDDMSRLVEVLARDADVVVVAGAPVLRGSEIELVPAGAGASLLVATVGTTRRPDVDVAVRHLSRSGWPVLGVVVADPHIKTAKTRDAPAGSRDGSSVDSSASTNSAAS